MFKKRHKKTASPSAAFHSWMEKKEEQFITFLEKSTLHWSNRRKIAVLALVVLLFSSFYTLLLIGVVNKESRHADYLHQEHIQQMSSPLNQHLKEWDKREKLIKPP